MKKTSWFIFLALIVFSCLDEPDCFRLNNNIVGISFKVLGSTRADTVRLTKLDLGTANGDYIADTASYVAFPLNYLASSMELTFTGGEIGTKNLHLDYRVQTQYVSEECGSRFVLSALDAPWNRNTFDSVRVVNATPGNTGGGVNIEVYRCPDPKKIGVAFHELYMEGDVIAPANRRSKAINADVKDILLNNGVVYTGTTGKSVASAYLPINVDSTASTYAFNFQQNQFSPESKNLRVTYTNIEQQPFGNACPARNYITKMMVDIEKTSFDSVGFVIRTNTSNGIPDTLKRVLDPVEINMNLYRCPKTNLVQIGFRKRNSSNSSTLADTVALASVTADYTDQVLLSNTSTLEYVQLPLNPDADETTFYIQYKRATLTRVDTVTIRYARARNTLFRACGIQTLFSGLNLVSPASNIRSTVNTSVKFPAVTNIEIIH